MTRTAQAGSRRALSITALLVLLVTGLSSVPVLFGSEYDAASTIPRHPAFQPGEILKYEVSWSKVLKAGKAVMEVKEQALPDGREVLAFTLSGRSSGVVGRIFPVHDRVESVFDPEIMQSLSYTITERHGRKKRHRTLVFDREQNMVVNTLNNDPPQTVSVPDGVQDSLAFLYLLRTRGDFTAGKVFTIDVHDSGRNWAIEVHTLGRERVKTPAGEFSTIKVKTRPLLEGTFQNKGEAYLWLTDDSRKVPVLMKSRIKTGSFVFTLQQAKPGV